MQMLYALCFAYRKTKIQTEKNNKKISYEKVKCAICEAYSHIAH